MRRLGFSLVFRSVAPGICFLLLGVWLSACSASGTPGPPGEATAPAATQVIPPSVNPSLDQPTLGSGDFDLRETALAGSGKPGPTLPPGELPPPGVLTPTPTITPTPLLAAQGTALPPAQAYQTPGQVPATLSQAEMETREAVLEQSGRPGATPLASSGSGCLGGAGLIVAVAGLGYHRYTRRPT